MFEQTQVDVQGKLPILQLQSNVISMLPFTMKQDPISLHALELQGNHVFEGAHQFLIESVEEGAPPIKICNIRFCEESKQALKWGFTGMDTYTYTHTNPYINNT